MDSHKVEAILIWNAPTSIKDVQIFLEFANFYRRFINDYSRVVSPMISLLKKVTKFSWTPAAELAFRCLQIAFTTAPIMTHSDPTFP